ncbi:hypothetical protein [Sphingomonas sp. MMS24-J13]|uniref:hypothetical protein n=1 Tax=Sphingomonas sp. MMS24-J13 TaxID=3238686 RepID=UPI00384E9E4A
MNLRMGAFWTGFAISALVAPSAWAQDNGSGEQQSRLQKTEHTAGSIAVQPLRDINAKKTVIPPVLQSAIAAPYSPAGAANCAQIQAGLRALNAVLGPDFGTGTAHNEDRASQLAAEGGKTVVNSLIPFRGLVREVSGAAPAERRLNAAMDGGYARRGFLRGVALAKNCKLR